MYSNGNFVDSTFEYWGTQSVAEIKQGADLPLAVGTECLVYVSTQVATPTPEYVTVQIQPQYSVFDTDAIHMVACLQSTGAVSAQAYSSPSWLWFIGGYGDYVSGNTFSDANGDRRCVRFVQGSANQWATAVAIDYHGNSTTQGYSKRLSFYGNSQTNYADSRFRLYISPLQVSANAGTASGTIATESSGTGATSGGGSDVDLTETNGLLSRIIAALSSLGDAIVDGIADLFVPDSEYIEQWQEDLQTSLETGLGGVYQSFSIITTFVNGLFTVTPNSHVAIDPVTIPLKWTNLTLGGWEWEIGYTGGNAGLSAVWTGLAWITDFICTAAFLMMCKRKLYAILSPVGEVVSDGS